MTTGKRMAARAGAKVGRKVGPRAARYAGKAAAKAARAEARLIRRALSSREPRGSRYMKYAVFALVGFAFGAALARSRGGQDDYSGASTGHHTPDPGSPAGRRGETWGSGTPLGGSGAGTSQGRAPEGSGGPLIGTSHDPDAGKVPQPQEDVENRVRTRLGEDPRTRELPRVNVQASDGVVELRGTAPTEDAKLAAGEIAAQTEGVREVRNLIQVS